MGPGNHIDTIQNLHVVELNALLDLVQTLNAAQQSGSTDKQMDTRYPSIEVSNSCIQQLSSTGSGGGGSGGSGGDGTGTTNNSGGLTRVQEAAIANNANR